MKLVSETVWYTKKEPATPSRRPLVALWNRIFNNWFVADSIQPWARPSSWTPPKKLIVQVWEVDE